MISTINLNNVTLKIDLDRGESIAIPLDPHGAQPAFFTAVPAAARPLRAGDYIGDVRLGGTCNAEVVELVPHCHGTHTECRGHLTRERLQVQETIYNAPCLAQLISLIPEQGEDDPSPLFTLPMLQATLREDLPVEALIVRTLPNDPERKARIYEHAAPYPVFSVEAMRWLSEHSLKHLLVDSPSLDPAHDAGALRVHRTWWCMDGRDGPGDVDPGRRSATEMIFVEDHLADDLYWLNIELSPLLGDATLSRPVIYPVEILK